MNIGREAGYPGELRVYADLDQLSQAGAELFVKIAAEAIKARGRFRVALSGGSTPKKVYELLATDPFKTRVAWDRVDFFWGDDRYVPADDRESNYRMAHEALLRHVPVPSANIHRVLTEITPPEAAAQAYEKDIHQTFGRSTSFPQFDLIYMGLGTNGHTASLFPHSSALKERSRLVLADYVDEVKMWRITMSAPLLNRGRTVAFVISGQDKAQVLREVLIGPRDPERLPAQLIVPEGELLWLVDKAAAAQVSDPGLKQRSA